MSQFIFEILEILSGILQSDRLTATWTITRILPDMEFLVKNYHYNSPFRLLLVKSNAKIPKTKHNMLYFGALFAQISVKINFLQNLGSVSS